MPQTAKIFTEFLKHAFASGKGYGKWFPDKVKVVSGGGGSCVCELTVDEDLVNGGNSMHGGCTATLVDMVTTLAIASHPSKPTPGVTVDMSVSYMAAARLGEEIVVSGRTIKAGKTLAFLTADITRKKDGQVLATGKQTMFLVN